MKKLLTLLLLATLCIACGSDDKEDGPENPPESTAKKIEFIVSPSSKYTGISLSIESNEVEIDWGDGEKETYKDKKVLMAGSTIGNTENLPDSYDFITHEYAEVGKDYKITINTENLEALRLIEGALVDMRINNCPNLSYLSIDNKVVYGSEIKTNSLDFGQCPKLEILHLMNFANCTNLNISNCPELMALTLRNCANLKVLDLNGNTELKKLNLLNNGLTELDLSNVKKLDQLRCNENNIAGKLDLNYNRMLVEAELDNNAIEEIDISNCFLLKEFSADFNQIKQVKIENSPQLRRLTLNDNKLGKDALNEIFTMLPDTNFQPGGSIDVFSNPGLDGCDFTIAERKNWSVFR